ncbi:MAG: TIGR00282 family metallophosphoesterase [Candidatus Puniceispirillaceae bacterium]
MKVLFLGDIVGRSARQAVIEKVPQLRDEMALDAVIVNCENAAGGFGVTPAICEALFDAGVDVLTTGNHIWDKAEISPYLQSQPRLLRPANMAREFPGSGSVIHKLDNGLRLGVMNVMCNLFMADNDNMFASLEKQLTEMQLGRDADFILVDVHGEATSEKVATGLFCDGRVSCVVGTHTHIPTADHRVLSGGTAYQTDAGMCGDYISVIGMDPDVAISRFTGRKSGRLAVAMGEPTLSGLLIETDDATGLALSAVPFRRGGVLHPA